MNLKLLALSGVVLLACGCERPGLSWKKSTGTRVIPPPESPRPAAAPAPVAAAAPDAPAAILQREIPTTAPSPTLRCSRLCLRQRRLVFLASQFEYLGPRQPPRAGVPADFAVSTLLNSAPCSTAVDSPMTFMRSIRPFKSPSAKWPRRGNQLSRPASTCQKYSTRARRTRPSRTDNRSLPPSTAPIRKNLKRASTSPTASYPISKRSE